MQYHNIRSAIAADAAGDELLLVFPVAVAIAVPNIVPPRRIVLMQREYRRPILSKLKKVIMWTATL
jgi:dihydroorotase